MPMDSGSLRRESEGTLREGVVTFLDGAGARYAGRALRFVTLRRKRPPGQATCAPSPPPRLRPPTRSGREARDWPFSQTCLNCAAAKRSAEVPPKPLSAQEPPEAPTSRRDAVPVRVMLAMALAATAVRRLSRAVGGARDGAGSAGEAALAVGARSWSGR